MSENNPIRVTYHIRLFLNLDIRVEWPISGFVWRTVNSNTAE